MTWPITLLILAVLVTLVRIPRVPVWIPVAVVAAVAVATGDAPWSLARRAVDLLAEPLGFLLLAVPLAALLDEIGYFEALAAHFASGRHLRSGLWLFAALTTVVLNLDAAIVLLTPLYVRIARRSGDDPIALAFIPALMSSLASTVLPVSNLTNLIVAGHLGLGVGDVLRNAAPASLAAVAAGWLMFRWTTPAAVGSAAIVPSPTDAAVTRVGHLVVAWLVLGFTVGDHLGVPAYAVAATALVGLLIWRGRWRIPWRHLPIGAAVLALGLGIVALAAAPDLGLHRITNRGGVSGELASFSAAALGANAVNNLPATMALLPALTTNPDNVWAVLLGVNLGPLLWPMGSLAIVLWQSMMDRLGHPVATRRYLSVGWRVGLPAIVAAVAVRLLIR